MIHIYFLYLDFAYHILIQEKNIFEALLQKCIPE